MSFSLPKFNALGLAPPGIPPNQQAGLNSPATLLGGFSQPGQQFSLTGNHQASDSFTSRTLSDGNAISNYPNLL